MKISESSLNILSYINDIMNETTNEGGGRIISKPKTYTKSIYDNLHSRFWKKKYLDRKFKPTIHDELFEVVHPSITVKGLATIWANENISPEKSISKILQDSGILKSKADELQKIFIIFENTCYSQSQIIDMALNYHLGIAYKPISAPTETHYFKNTIVDKWFMHNNDRIFNLSERCSISLEPVIKEIINNLSVYSQLNNKNDTIYFHTTNWDGARNILTKINHNKGKLCLDFGSGPSFYIGRDIRDTLDWGERQGKCSSNEVATFIFSIPKVLPSEYIFKTLKGDEWVHIIKKSRNCENYDYFNDDRHLIRSLENYEEYPEIREADFIYGNMASNISQIISGKTPLAHKPPKKQLASKTKKGDLYLQSRLIGCIFFQKYNPYIIGR